MKSRLSSFSGAVPSCANRCGNLLRLQLQLNNEGNSLCKVGSCQKHQIQNFSTPKTERLIAELKQKESTEERLKVLEVKKGKVGFDMGLKVTF